MGISSMYPDLFNARAVLEDCRADWALWMHNGIIVRNIHELVSAIENMNEEEFRYHVNEDNQKNDFAKWIKEVLGDKELAKTLEPIRNKEEYTNTIRKRIEQIEEYLM